MLDTRSIQAVTALHDLPRLVAEFGHEPLWEPFDPRAAGLGRPADAMEDAAIVGRAGGFTWYGVASQEPARVAPRLARRLTERGRICGVIGLDARLRRLAVAVGLEGTAVVELDLDQPGRLATSCLARLGEAANGDALGIAVRAAEALSGAGVGALFFTTFRATLERFVASLPASIPERHRHQLGLLQLTRVLFLYFVQGKGWLDGSDNFLRRHVDDCLFRHRRVHADLLMPLFFGTLNRPPEARGAPNRAFGRVPFLNGGLFEPHPLERAYRAPVPNSAWRDAFDTLFERFHFTAVEDTTGSVAHDMLGRVFEGVMEPGLRKETGTYYTPRALVRSVVDAALSSWVGGRLGIPDAEALARLDAGEGGATALLANVTVLDPAVGSGAFLLGALERLAGLQSPSGPGNAARRIVAHNLFGVDRNPAAVRLCELRLWLAVIEREPDGTPESVRPLPNLDASVRQGDSLSDPLRMMLRHPVRATPHAAALAAARAAVAASTGASKREGLRLLRRLETETAADRLAAAIAERERLVAELLASGREATLFADRRGLDPRARRGLRRAREELRSLRRDARTLAEEGASPTFDFDTQFADVMSQGGFDLVLGNPPWVRAEALAPSVRSELRERFRWWRTDGGPGYRHQPDLSIAFLERGWELTKPGGVLAMLVPAKFATTGYGTAARAALSEQGTVVAFADLTGRPEARFDATTYPLGVIVRAGRPPTGHRPRIGLSPGAVPSTRLPPEGAAWLARPQALVELLQRLGRHAPLHSRFRIQLGVKTGANHVFVDPPPEVEPSLVRPLLRGREIRPWVAAPGGRVLWTHDERGAPLASLLPGAARHCACHADALRRRRDLKGQPRWGLFRAEAGARVPRVVWADLGLRLEAACLLGREAPGIVPLNSCYVVRCRTDEEALALCAWLNTTWSRAVARVHADVASGGYARFNARAVGTIPLPADVIEDPRLVALARRALAGEDCGAELDAVCGTWLGLERDDRRLLAEVVGVGAVRRR